MWKMDPEVKMWLQNLCKEDPGLALTHSPLWPFSWPCGKEETPPSRKGVVTCWNDFEYFKVLSVNNKNEITLKYSRVWAAGVNESSRSLMPVPLIEA